MLDIGTILLIIAIVLGFYVAWNIGANDVANAMGTSVGSGALKLWQAVVLAAILEFAGALLLGSHVSSTIESGVIDPLQFSGDPRPYILGMLGSLLAVGVWLQIASYFGWPVSTTHTIIGAIAGFGLIAIGIHGIHWGTLLAIVISWVISPILGGALGYIVFTQIRRRILYKREPIKAAKRATPVLVFFVFGILSLVLLFQGLEHATQHLNFWSALGLAIGIGAVAALISWLLVRLIPTPPMVHEDVQSEDVTISLDKALRHLRRVVGEATDSIQGQAKTLLKGARDLAGQVQAHAHFEALESQTRVVEKIFVYLQILSACFMAFAHGSNDVANAMGPLAGIIRVLHTGLITRGGPVPLWILALGGAGIVVGLATWGWRVIATVGKKITELTPTRGFAAEFSAATTVVIASRLGLPVSTTHTLIGAVLGVGLARGISALNLNVLRDIVISWVVTVPAGAILSILFYHGLKLIFS